MFVCLFYEFCAVEVMLIPSYAVSFSCWFIATVVYFQIVVTLLIPKELSLQYYFAITLMNRTHTLLCHNLGNQTVRLELLIFYCSETVSTVTTRYKEVLGKKEGKKKKSQPWSSFLYERLNSYHSSSNSKFIKYYKCCFLQ